MWSNRQPLPSFRAFHKNVFLDQLNDQDESIQKSLLLGRLG